MDVSLFGPLWIMLHFYAYFLPKGPLSTDTLKTFLQFVEQFVSLVPCGGCSSHASLYFLQNYHSLMNCKTGQHVFEWTVTFHNHVNKTLQCRQYSTLEAESALRMHLSGLSTKQLAIEEKHTLHLQKMNKLQDKILILNNKSHKIDTAVNDDLTCGLHLEEFKQDSNAYDAVFKAFMLIALEKNQDQPMNVQLAECVQTFLRCGFELFPNLKIAMDSKQYLITNKPKLRNGSDFLRFVVAWKNYVTGDTLSEKETVFTIDEWAKAQKQRHTRMLATTNEHHKKLIELQRSYDVMLQERKLRDASGDATVQKTQNMWIYFLAAIAIVLLVILIVMIVLYCREKNANNQKKTQ